MGFMKEDNLSVFSGGVFWNRGNLSPPVLADSEETKLEA